MSTPPPPIDYQAILQEAEGAFGPSSLDAPVDVDHADVGVDVFNALHAVHSAHERGVGGEAGGQREDEEDEGEFVPLLEQEGGMEHVFQTATGSADPIDNSGMEAIHSEHQPVEQVGQEGTGGAEAEAEAAGGSETPRKGLGLTAAEKKNRQRVQNRKAAEKSRSKKRGEVALLEESVENMQEENARLRQRLSTLLGRANADMPAAPPSDAAAATTADTSTSVPPTADSLIDPSLALAEGPSSSLPPATGVAGSTVNANGTGIDYAYFTKLHSELLSARSTLVERQIELSRLIRQASQRSPEEGTSSSNIDQPLVPPEPTEETTALRTQLLATHSKLGGLEVERKSLEFILGVLRGEIQSLGEQKERVGRELERRQGGATASSASGDIGTAGIAGAAVGASALGTEVHTPTPVPVRGGSAQHPSSTSGTNGGGGGGAQQSASRHGAVPAIQTPRHSLAGPSDTQPTGMTGLAPGPDTVQDSSAGTGTAAGAEAEAEAAGDTEDLTRESDSVDKALLDIRGWIDAAVKGWDEDQMGT